MANRGKYQVILGIGLLTAAALIIYGGYRLVMAPNALQQTATAPAAVERVPEKTVLVAARAIARGTALNEADAKPLAVKGDVPGGAVSFQEIAGKVALADIQANQIIFPDMLSPEPARAGLSALVPQGMRAVAVRVTDEIAVGNFLRAGDFVDVQIVLRENVLRGGAAAESASNPSEARTLLQNVKVLTVGDLLAAGEPAREGRVEQFRHVTLAMTPEQASQIMLARSMGSIFLSLRNGQDLLAVSTPTVRLETLRGSDSAPSEPAAMPSDRRRIEMFVGRGSKVVHVPSGVGE